MDATTTIQIFKEGMMGGGSAKKITRGLFGIATGGLSEVARAAGIEKLDPGKPAREAERHFIFVYTS